MDKYLRFLVTQAFVNGLKSHKLRQNLEDILPKGCYDFQDIYPAFRELRSCYAAKTSFTVPIQVLTVPAAISVSTVLEVSSTAAFQPSLDLIGMTSKVPEL
jgi:hypothetical protein